ncbi:maltose ABC transporter substrate-binding protein [Microbacterium sp. NIBRBAC000506063]|uniref:sugar ABC transporter substrate-binding protein n=1 Tax=Microbacterium sp. NIBRBAC000506063 TaxID=2734618 RepID=UPI001BB4E5E7|nr:maltose ABC transporter substrate-binding protein [Microbacterium sp. NIBRBAC000506063]QTV79179.1 maltose ABC transporter substrate-binding protein [Microbacterium sp. NIBRBAC000506063]
MKVNKRGILALGAIAAISSLTLAGCAGGGDPTPAEPSDPPVEYSGEITVWVDADRAGVLEAAADDFTNATGVQVTLVQKEFGEIRDQLVQQVPTGEGPDVAVGAHDWLGELVTNGVVAPVELGDRAGEFEQVALDAFNYDGQNYGVPYAIESIALLRNTDLVSEAPTDYDDMIAKGEAAGTRYSFLVGLDPEAADPYHLYPFQTSFGAPVFGTAADGSYDASDLQIGNAGGEAFAEWLAEQGAAGVLNTNINGDLARENFVDGNAPFFLTGPWNVPAALDAGLNIAVDPIPSAGGQDAQPFAGVQGFFLSARSENRLAANEFLLNYVGSEEVQTALYEVGGRAPALSAAFTSAVAGDPITAGFGEVGANAVPMPSIPEMGAVWQYWGVTEAAIINGSDDPVGLWQKMAADVAGATQ